MPSRPGPAQHRFSQVPKADIPRSVFDRSFGYKSTFSEGYLIPFYVDEALPGDTFVMDMSAFVRLATPLKPIMDNMYVETFFFAVPYRLVWANWQKFNGEQTNPGDSTSFVIPTITSVAATWTTHSIYDYMGIPIGLTGLVHSCLPLRAYNLIYNQWFRDQNLQNSLTVNTGDGPDVAASYGLKRRGKRHDYFTSALPWPQKGSSVSLPLGTSAPVVANNPSAGIYVKGDYGGGGHNTTVPISEAAAAHSFTSGGLIGVTAQPVWWADPNLKADLTSATAATINQLRQAFQIQKLLERDARGGTRYTEIIEAHFRVKSSDARLQRPEYLGGGSVPMFVSPVAQTSSTDATTPQGNLSGVGTATITRHGFHKSFEEHCILIGIINVRADLNYGQGLEKQWFRSTRYDFYWPAFAMIGEQAIYNREIYAKAVAADADVFGYQERYAEYRYKPSLTTGLMRVTVTAGATSIAIWHLAQEFSSLPTLGDTFIQESAPMTRVKAVASEVDFILDAFCKLRCARPMPVYGVPGLIDHF